VLKVEEQIKFKKKKIKKKKLPVRIFAGKVVGCLLEERSAGAMLVVLLENFSSSSGCIGGSVKSAVANKQLHSPVEAVHGLLRMLVSQDVGSELQVAGSIALGAVSEITVGRGEKRIGSLANFFF
jgi:hypothetical protein